MQESNNVQIMLGGYQRKYFWLFMNRFMNQVEIKTVSIMMVS